MSHKMTEKQAALMQALVEMSEWACASESDLVVRGSLKDEADRLVVQGFLREESQGVYRLTTVADTLPCVSEWRELCGI